MLTPTVECERVCSRIAMDKRLSGTWRGDSAGGSHRPEDARRKCWVHHAAGLLLVDTHNHMCMYALLTDQADCEGRGMDA